MIPRRCSVAMLATVMAMSTPAMATQVRVTVTNTAQTGGLSFTPLYTAFHDGSVDLFDEGAAASAGIENIAEAGIFDDLRDERLALQANSVGGVAVGAGGAVPGPLEPGESASFIVDLEAVANRFLSFFAMVLPSNDTFIGNDDATQFALFDASGNFLGDQTFDITGAFAYDAGTEINDPDVGPAFVVGRDISLGGEENGVIMPATSLTDFVGLTLAGGLMLDPSQIDFVTDPDSFLFGRIQVEEVPLPPAVFLMMAGLAGLGAAGKKKSLKSQQA